MFDVCASSVVLFFVALNCLSVALFMKSIGRLIGRLLSESIRLQEEVVNLQLVAEGAPQCLGPLSIHQIRYRFWR